MVVSRDPLGLRPMNWAVQGRLFAAASESVALSNLGFTEIVPMEPGQIATIEDGRLRLERIASPRRLARCFFEWVYFSHVASVIDGSSVYLARAGLGRRLAEMEDQRLDDQCVVVPVPDTAKAASDAFAHDVGVACVEGLIRNRSVGRTFIQPSSIRTPSAKRKYTPMPSVLKGKRVFLVEDSIVRGTTLKALARRMRQVGGAKEIHVRVACPPIVAPCFYGIDMSTLGELFAPRFVSGRYAGALSAEIQAEMARELGVDSLRYLPVADLAPCLDVPADSLCTACVTRSYPTPWGRKLLATAKRHLGSERQARTYE
jgi:amidophosphoribosyltransferase